MRSLRDQPRTALLRAPVHTMQIRFLDFEVDLATYQLLNEGQPVDIGGRALDLLVYLIRNSDRVVTHEELRRDVWGGSNLSSAAIPTAIMEVRNCLADDARNPRIVFAIRGRGYRFNPEIQIDSTIRQRERAALPRMPLIAREAELDMFSIVARAVRDRRRGHTLVVQGIAGVGKTRLVDEGVEQHLSDFAVLVCRCSTIEGSPPFWPWTRLIADATSMHAGTRREFLDHASRLAKVHPELCGTVFSEGESSAPENRFALFNTWIGAIRGLAMDSPLAIVFEDAHCADQDSLALLACLAEEIDNVPVMLVATHRPATFSGARAQRLTEIAAAPKARTIRLEPLSDADVARLLRAYGKTSPALATRLHDASRGLPFYISQILQTVARMESTTSFEAVLDDLPLDVSAIVSRQLSNLSQETRYTISAAALAGDRFGVSLIADILQKTPDEVVEAIQPAVQAELISEYRGEFEFRHRLLREALAATLDSKSARTLHLAIATHLANQPDGQAQSAKISDHLTLARPLGSHKTLIHFSKLASDQASARFAYQIAAHYLERALLSGDAASSLSASERTLTMIRIAQLVHYAGQRQRSRELLETTLEIARAESLPEAYAEAALLLSSDYLEIEFESRSPELIEHLEAGLRMLPPQSEALRGRLCARLALVLRWAGVHSEAKSWAQEARRIANDCSCSDVLVASLTAEFECLSEPANTLNRQQTIRRLRDLTRDSSDHATRILTIERSITSNLEIGDVEGAERENEVLREIISRRPQPAYEWYATAHDAAFALLRGQVHRSKSLLDRVEAIAAESPAINAQHTVYAQSALQSFELDRPTLVRSSVEMLAREHSSWRCAMVLMLSEIGDFSSARKHLDEIGPSDINRIACDPSGSHSLAMLAESASATGTWKYLGLLYEILASAPPQHVIVGYGIGYFGSLSRYSGILASRIGMHEEADHHLESAIHAEQSIGAPSWSAYAQADLISARAAASAPTDDLVERARQCLRETRELGLSRASRKLAYALSIASAEGAGGPADA